jgi:hypothetical protein
MTKFLTWLVARLSSALEPDLRESAVGDLTELNASYAKTIYELLGLILRQEAQLWRTWRPWLALIGIVGAIGWLLSSVCLGLIGDIARQASVYWLYGVAYHRGLTGTQEIEIVFCTSMAVVCWSWLAGFALATLSGKTVHLNRTLFCLVWFCLCGPLGLLVYSARLVLNALNLWPLPHAVGFSALAFFMTVHLPLAVLLFLIPSLLGMRRARQSPDIARPNALFFSATVAVLTTLVIWMQGWQQAALQKWSEGKWNPAGPPWQERLVPLVLSWPIVYLLATQMHRDKKQRIIGSGSI